MHSQIHTALCTIASRVACALPFMLKNRVQTCSRAQNIAQLALQAADSLPQHLLLRQMCSCGSLPLLLVLHAHQGGNCLRLTPQCCLAPSYTCTQPSAGSQSGRAGSKRDNGEKCGTVPCRCQYSSCIPTHAPWWCDRAQGRGATVRAASRPLAPPGKRGGGLPSAVVEQHRERTCDFAHRALCRGTGTLVMSLPVR